MVEAEAQVKCGVAKLGTFRIDKHRSCRANENVLGADIAMNQGELSPFRSLCERIELCSYLRMGASGRKQIRLYPYRVKNGIGLKLARQDLRLRRDRMNSRQTRADISGGFGMDDAVRQHLFPIRVFVWGQVLHREHRPVLLLIKDFRYALRHECTDGPEPGGFKRVALDGRMPIRRDAKLRQRTFDAEAFRPCRYEPNV